MSAMDGLIAEVSEQLEALTLTSDGLARIRGHARSADGAITAEVAGDGTLAALVLAESVTGWPPETAAADITATITAAHADAARQRAALLARLGDALA